MQNSMLNLACSSLTGRWWISALGMLWLVPTDTRLTCSGLMSCLRIRSIITAMPGCVSEPRGCGLIETPGASKVHGLPSLPSIISGL